MKIMITGAGGMLGSDMVSTARGLDHEVVVVDRAAFDLSDEVAVRAAVQSAAPDAVINCAAWTDVDGAEEYEPEAALVNAQGAGNLAIAAATVGAKICQISTDYVFDGTKEGAYVESDPTAPLQAYGRSKLAGEQAVRSASPEHFIVRTSWLFGPANQRPNFVETMLKAGSAGGPVEVVDDQIGCPTYTGHLADGILELIESTSFGIHHMAGSGACSWYGFSKELFEQAGVDADLVAADTASSDRPAKRPANSVLNSERKTPVVLPDWQSGLDQYLQRRQTTKTGEEQA